jgi:16S rRNA (cytosine967-C5)-methyltransferase
MVEAASMDNRRPNDAKRKPGPPQKKAPPPPPPGLAPRRAALDILTLVAAGRMLDQALEDCRSFNALEGPDRGLAHALVAAVLRRRGSIDQLIGHYIDRPIPKRSARATDVLRLSVAQSLFLKTPDHAVVSTSVALVQEFRETAGYSGLVNAVARKIAAGGAEALGKLPERIDTPGWMWRGWERSFGADGARAISRAHQSEAPIDLTPREPAEAEKIAQETGGAVLPTGSIRVPPGSRIPKLSGFEEGAWWVQDAAAALPARLLGDVRGKLVFDLCAAPGGKTMQLAAAGAEVVAVDHEGARLKTVAENLARTGLVAETIKADILDWTPTRLADAILLDSPCTATGTIRRHPDILWSKTEADLASLAALQARLIDRALRLLKPGGLLVYCTCSLQPEEGEKQAAAALARHKVLRRIAVAPAEIFGLAAITRDGDLRTLPSLLAAQGGMDGFFAARFCLE